MRNLKKIRKLFLLFFITTILCRASNDNIIESSSDDTSPYVEHSFSPQAQQEKKENILNTLNRYDDFKEYLKDKENHFTEVIDHYVKKDEIDDNCNSALVQILSKEFEYFRAVFFIESEDKLFTHFQIALIRYLQKDDIYELSKNTSTYDRLLTVLLFERMINFHIDGFIAKEKEKKNLTHEEENQEKEHYEILIKTGRLINSIAQIPIRNYSERKQKEGGFHYFDLVIKFLLPKLPWQSLKTK